MSGDETRISSPPARSRRGRVLGWALAVVSLAVVLAATLLLARHYGRRPRSVVESAPQEIPAADPSAPVGDCRSPATDALGLGSTTFASKEDLAAAFGDELLLPDPRTLPEGAVLVAGRYTASMKGTFRQSILGLRFEAPEVMLEILIFNVGPYDGPVEENTPVNVRGKRGYLFRPPFREGAHSVMWREDCRWVTVEADLPAEAVLAIAEGLRSPPAGDRQAP